MKKWLIAVLLFVIVVLGASWFLIPAEEVFTCSESTHCPAVAVQRILINKDTWKQWWPGQKKNDSVYSFRGYDYAISKIYFNGFDANLTDGQNNIATVFSADGLNIDSTIFSFKVNFVYDKNPITRLLQYIEAGTVKSDLRNLLIGMKDYFSSEKNVYGFKVKEQRVTDSALIAMKTTFNHYPTNAEVYGMIDSVKNYVASVGAKEINPPMLNIYTEDSVTFYTMVAIPTNGLYPGKGKFQVKEMVLGNILMAEVKGGPEAIKEGERQLKNYVDDYQKSSPAIPFQSLVTDRIRETDTSKWITKLYYPVF